MLGAQSSPAISCRNLLAVLGRERSSLKIESWFTTLSRSDSLAMLQCSRSLTRRLAYPFSGLVAVSKSDSTIPARCHIVAVLPVLRPEPVNPVNLELFGLSPGDAPSKGHEPNVLRSIFADGPTDALPTTLAVLTKAVFHCLCSDPDVEFTVREANCVNTGRQIQSFSESPVIWLAMSTFFRRASTIFSSTVPGHTISMYCTG